MGGKGNGTMDKVDRKSNIIKPSCFALPDKPNKFLCRKLRSNKSNEEKRDAKKSNKHVKKSKKTVKAKQADVKTQKVDQNKKFIKKIEKKGNATMIKDKTRKKNIKKKKNKKKKKKVRNKN